jgi:hypothetical protein
MRLMRVFKHDNVMENILQAMWRQILQSAGVSILFLTQALAGVQFFPTIDKAMEVKMNEQSELNLNRYIDDIQNSAEVHMFNLFRVIPKEHWDGQVTHVFSALLIHITGNMHIYNQTKKQENLLDLKASLNAMNTFLADWDSGKDYFKSRLGEDNLHIVTGRIEMFTIDFHANYKEALQEIEELTNVGSSFEASSIPLKVH